MDNLSMAPEEHEIFRVCVLICFLPLRFLSANIWTVNSTAT